MYNIWQKHFFNRLALIWFSSFLNVPIYQYISHIWWCTWLSQIAEVRFHQERFILEYTAKCKSFTLCVLCIVTYHRESQSDQTLQNSDSVQMDSWPHSVFSAIYRTSPMGWCLCRSNEHIRWSSRSVDGYSAALAPVECYPRLRDIRTHLAASDYYSSETAGPSPGPRSEHCYTWWASAVHGNSGRDNPVLRPLCWICGRRFPDPTRTEIQGWGSGCINVWLKCL